MTNEEIDYLLRALEAAKQLRKEDALLRDLATDAYRRPQEPTLPGVRVVGADQVLGPGEGKGWRNAPRVDDWRPPGARYLDAMLDADDRAQRKRGEGR